MKPIVIIGGSQDEIIEQLLKYLQNEQTEIIFQGDLNQDNDSKWYMLLIIKGE